MLNVHDTIAAYVLDLNQQSFKAAIDWQAFEVTLQSPSQFRHLQARTQKIWGKTHFTQVPGSSAKSWKFRVQNPTGPAQFMQDVQAMARPGDPRITERDIRILGTEIALDVYHCKGNRSALMEAVLHLLRHQAHPLMGEPRITGKHTFKLPTSPYQVLQALHQGDVTIRTGPQDADHTCRFYFKDYDTVDGVPYVPLPQAQWRARFENTLQGDAVPFRSIKEWREFKFESLSNNIFALLMPCPARSALVQSMQARKVQLGRRPDSYKRCQSERRQRGAFTRRDSLANEKIRQALRALTTAQSCRNSVKMAPKPGLWPLHKPLQPRRAPKYLEGISNHNLGMVQGVTIQSTVTHWCHGTVWKEQRGPPVHAMSKTKSALFAADGLCQSFRYKND